jgi:tRNA splicing endonuclease
VVGKSGYSVGSGAANQAYKDLKEWGIITQDGQNFTSEFQCYKQNPPR